jgi:hypothetical protein
MNVTDPRDIKKLKSLCGLISYASKLIKDAATLIIPFHQSVRHYKKKHAVHLEKRI